VPELPVGLLEKSLSRAPAKRPAGDRAKLSFL
jgi:hypothetical protein